MFLVFWSPGLLVVWSSGALVFWSVGLVDSSPPGLISLVLYLLHPGADLHCEQGHSDHHNQPAEDQIFAISFGASFLDSMNSAVVDLRSDNEPAMLPASPAAKYQQCVGS